MQEWQLSRWTIVHRNSSPGWRPLSSGNGLARCRQILTTAKLRKNLKTVEPSRRAPFQRLPGVTVQHVTENLEQHLRRQLCLLQDVRSSRGFGVLDQLWNESVRVNQDRKIAQFVIRSNSLQN